MSTPRIYIGTKAIKAKPMTKECFEAFKKDPSYWSKAFLSESDADGYAVEYLDGGPANYPDVSEHYISWSPKDVFEAAYVANGDLPGWLALKYALEGKEVRIANVVIGGNQQCDHWHKLHVALTDHPASAEIKLKKYSLATTYCDQTLVLSPDVVYDPGYTWEVRF